MHRALLKFKKSLCNFFHLFQSNDSNIYRSSKLSLFRNFILVNAFTPANLLLETRKVDRSAICNCECKNELSRWSITIWVFQMKLPLFMLTDLLFRWFILFLLIRIKFRKSKKNSRSLSFHLNLPFRCQLIIYKFRKKLKIKTKKKLSNSHLKI